MIKQRDNTRYDTATGYTWQWQKIGHWDVWGYTVTWTLVRIK